MRTFLALLLLCCLLPACAQVNIVPQIQSGSQIDIDSRSINRQQEDISVTVRMADAHVRPSPVEQNYASFWIEVDNQGNTALPLSLQDFTLLDADGHHYAAQSPDELVTLLKPETSYLIPYPYVGYYYLGDSERAKVSDQFRSEASYAGSRRPEYIKLDALPEGEVPPHAKVTGMIYFSAELTRMRSFDVRYQSAPRSGQATLPFNFSFSVEKN
ncbi:MAG TPA: hypothetical protein VIR78_05575 [Malonomonas sp.]